MKLNKLAIIGTTLFLTSTMAAAELELSGNVSLNSDYMFRGVSQTDNSPAIQGGFDATYGGFYAGTWASNVDSNFYAGANMEWDFYAGYGGEIGETGISYDLGWLLYYYPGTSFNDNNTHEFHVGVGYDFGGASVGYTLNYSDDFYGLQEAIYHNMSLDIPLGEDFTFSAHYGITDFDNDTLGDDYEDMSLGLSTSLAGFDVSVTWVDNSGATAASTSNLYDDRIVLSVGKSF